VKSATSEVRKAINNNSEQNPNAKKALYTNASVKPNNREIAERFGHELERLRIENDPMWRLEVPMGRLNVARSMHSNINDIDRLFDRWDIGNDNRDIEAVVLVDNSGSMMFNMNSTLEAMWAIKRGVEQIDGRVTVFRFNDNTRVVYGADEKASPTEYRSLNSSGGTNPYEALLEADRILSNSDRAIKLLFIISDGEWHNAERCNEIISRMNQVEGMLTVAVFLGDLEGWRKHYSEEYIAEALIRYQHGADMLHVVAEPKDLIDVAIKVVKETMTVAH
jgi:Mg-chelatase subunit ChlD